MSATEIKIEIEKILDTVPEDILQSVLNYLQSIIGKQEDTVKLSGNIRKILEEDRELLEKLAQ